MNGPDVPQLLDLAGIFVFAVSGALAAVRKRLDVVGMVVLAEITALGGGILRDLLIGAVPPAAFTSIQATACASPPRSPVCASRYGTQSAVMRARSLVFARAMRRCDGSRTEASARSALRSSGGMSTNTSNARASVVSMSSPARTTASVAACTRSKRCARVAR